MYSVAFVVIETNPACRCDHEADRRHRHRGARDEIKRYAAPGTEHPQIEHEHRTEKG